jgi:hypothetical protein
MTRSSVDRTVTGSGPVHRRRRDTPRPRKSFFHPPVEALEPRCLPAILAIPASVAVVQETEPNNTLNQAQDLGAVSATTTVAATGAVGNWNHEANDVDWYSFELNTPASVHLGIGPARDGTNFQGVVSLYNNDPFDFADPFTLTGHRLLVQSQAPAPGEPASIDRVLGPGTYYVAVSGAGNLDFHPMMAGSGLDGSTGDYNLVVTALAAVPDATGPAVLASDPASGSTLGSAPLAVRVDFSMSLDPSTIFPGQTVRLVYNPAGTFGDGQDSDITLGSVNFSDSAHEL